MDATPPDGSVPAPAVPAGPRVDGDDGRDGVPVDAPAPPEPASPDDDGSPADPDRDSGGSTAPVPPRAGPVPLPRRTHRRRGNAEPDAAPRRSPDGRPYSAPDEMTLSRLLAGLRDI